MSVPTTEKERIEYREALAQRAAERMKLWGRSLTCEHPDFGSHSTCVGNTDPSRCLCPCHDKGPSR